MKPKRELPQNLSFPIKVLHWASCLIYNEGLSYLAQNTLGFVEGFAMLFG